MLIHEVAKRCNITKKAIQYYVEQGLVVPRFWKMGIVIFQKKTLKS